MQPDLETLSSLRSIFDQIDFKKFRAFLEALEKDEIYRAINATENQAIAQGRAQMIMWLRHEIETCKQAASKMEVRTNAHPPSRARGR